jgi:ATP synthase, F1 delta subunit
MPLVDKRYAEALVDVAETNNALEKVQEELRLFAESYSTLPEFRSFFRTPEIGNDEKRNTLKMLLKDSSTILLPFLLLLIDKGRLVNLPGIYSEYVDLADKRKKVLHLEVRVAAAIDDGQLSRIKEKYKKEYGATDVKANITVDPGLLGGIVIQIGDRVIDASIKGRLQGLKEATVKM